MKCDSVCVVFAANDIANEFKFHLNGEFQIFIEHQIFKVLSILYQKPDCCLVAHLDTKNKDCINSLAQAKTEFPHIPIIAIDTDNNLEMVRLCGEIGIQHVMSKRDLKSLNEILIIASAQNKLFNLDELGFSNNNRKKLDEILNYIIKNHSNIKTINDICTHFKTSYTTISQLCKNKTNFGPKHILLLCKIKHAIHLMQKTNLNFNEIAQKTGFSDTRRFNECFNRNFNLSPSKFKEKILNRELSNIDSLHIADILKKGINN